MAKLRPNRRTGPTFVQLFHYVLDSPGYRALSVTARATLVEVATLYHGDNNGRLVASVRWLAGRLNVGKSTAARALVELEDNGLIEPTKIATFHRHTRTAAEYRLTFHRCDVSYQAASRAFMRALPTYGVHVEGVPPMGPSNGANHARRSHP